MFIVGLIHLAAVLCALAFYGQRVQSMLLPDTRLDAGTLIAFGLAAYTGFCGLLEVTQLASRQLLLGLLVIGVLGFAASWLRQPKPPLVASTAAMTKGVAAAFAIFGVVYALFLINTADWHYGFVDDILGYLVFPERILGEGSIGRDPFNFRRIESGLTGGGAYLYALFRAGLPLRQTRLADIGIGSACLLLAVRAHAREQGVVGPRLAVMLLITLGVIVFSPAWNNTPETTGKGLLFVLFRVAYVVQPRPPSLRRGAALGLLFFAAVALKTAYLPVAVAGLAAFYASLLWERPALRLVGEAAVAGVAALLPMIPWMAAAYATAGTPWYPLLGIGTLNPSEVSGMAAPYTHLTEAGRLAAVLAPALLIALAAWFSPALQQRRLLLAALALSSFALMLVSQLKITVFGYRYGQAGVAAVMLFYLPLAAKCQMMRFTRLALSCLIVVMLAALVTKDMNRTPWFDSGWIAERALGPVRFDSGQRWEDRIGRLHAMQEAVPPGRPLLAVLSWPALLDFKRNPVAVMDHPAMMGPAGLPTAHDPEGWSRYLISLGFRYVAYSYADEAALPTRVAERERNRYREPWQASPYMVADTTATIEMHETLLALRQYGTIIYDDGDEFVVRLEDR